MNEHERQTMQEIHQALTIYRDPALYGKVIPKVLVDDLEWLLEFVGRHQTCQPQESLTA